MAGIGEAASVVSFISLTVQLFDGCVKGFVLLSAAQELGSRGDVLGCQLEWEHYCLNDWAKTVGLFKEPPELNVPYPPIVESTLLNLKQLLTDATKLRRDYGLDVTITDEEIRDIHAPKRLFGRMLEKTKPQFVNDTAKVYSRRNGAWKRVKWASLDAEKLRLLLKDIHYFNKQLRGLLHQTEQRSKWTEDSSLMRSIVSQTSDKSLLDIMAEPLSTVNQAIAASARFKHQGLLLDLVAPSKSRSSTSSSQTTLTPPSTRPVNRRPSPGQKPQMRRSADLLSECTGHLSLAVFREIAQYDGRPVIVEWKDVDRALESKLKYRITNVAALLAEMDDPSFHSLTCFGFLKAPRSGRYAYLFEPPIGISSHFSMKSLQDILNSQTLRPSLNYRIAVAVNLTETVLQLHTSGWLHKCIRPDNVLFFKTSDEEWNSNDQLPPAYLSGYEYARADNPLESTEAPSAQRHSQLYRHPLSIGQGRVSFIKVFDLYGLGCVLLEIGLWAPLQSILLRHLRLHAMPVPISSEAVLSTSVLEPRNDAEYYSMVGEKQRLLRETGPGTILSELRHRMGTAYGRIVMNCLHAPTNQLGKDDEEYDESIDIQEESLTALQVIAAAI